MKTSNQNQNKSRMGTYRVLDDTFKILKTIDPDTAISKHALRHLVLDAENGKNSEIKIVKIGAKRLICVESVLEYFGIGRADVPYAG